MPLSQIAHKARETVTPAADVSLLDDVFNMNRKIVPRE
jgi:hypothetical protein